MLTSSCQSLLAGPRRLHRLVRSKTEDRECRGDLLEFRKRCILVHGHVGSRSRCSLQVSPQDGGALVGGNLFEVDLLTTAAPENRPSTGCPYVVDPLHVISEHRHQVPLSIDDGHDHRQRDSPPRLSSGHFQCHEVVGRDPRRGHSSRRPIQNPRNPVGSLPTVQPPSEVAESHLSRRTFLCHLSSVSSGTSSWTLLPNVLFTSVVPSSLSHSYCRWTPAHQPRWSVAACTPATLGGLHNLV